MVRIALVAPSRGEQRELDADSFLLRGGQLEKEPDAEPVAFGGEAGWRVESERFARAECDELVACRFESDGDVGETSGPFLGISIAAGILRSGETVIATLRGSYWQSTTSRKAWPRVRITNARDSEAAQWRIDQ